ncbi:MAG: hypothetical protein PHD72_03720 [Patescibacteria group bacterium]|nr:hypothetical protein [Patescibacteria group bacterium]
MNKARRMIVGVIFGAMLFAPIFVFSAADKYGLQNTARNTPLASMSLSNETPESLAATIVRTVLFFVGTIFFLLILYAGLKWMTAMGATDKINEAKTILETALIGLLITAASFAISSFIFTRLQTGEDPNAGAGGNSGQETWCQVTDETDGSVTCSPISDTEEQWTMCQNDFKGSVVYGTCEETP